jgi:mRNA interferase MazF
MPPHVKDSGLSFHPHAGTYLMCDFHGCVEPEINKRRPVIVVTPRLLFRDRLCMVVPTSTTEPNRLQPYHVRLSRNYHPKEDDEIAVWAKCDLITNVSCARLDRFKVGHRKYLAPRITNEDLDAVRLGVLAALGFRNLTVAE